MRINLNQLGVFYLVGRHKKMAAAAKILYVSTPAVTMQIKNLESWLGFSVFKRGGGALTFTERGKALFDIIEPLFLEFEKLEYCLQDLVQTEEVTLTLGTHHLPGSYFLFDLITHVQAKYPKLRVQTELGTEAMLLEALVQKKIDLALVAGGLPDSKTYKAVHLFDQDLVLVASAGSQLGKLTSIAVSDLAQVPLILQEKGSGPRRVLFEFLHRHGVQPNILLDNFSSDVIKQFLPTMEAAAFISRFVVQKELDAGLLHEIAVIADIPPVCRFYLVYLDAPHIPAKIKDFFSAVEGFSPKLLTPAS